MMFLFTEQINNWDDWGKVFQSIPAFTPLVEFIFKKERLPMSIIENLHPGSNAVFKVGGFVIKIFAPSGLNEDYGTDADVELFGMKWANARGIPAPKLIADGFVEDKYIFRYMIMEYIHGKMLGEIENNLSYEDKVNIGNQIRSITDKMNAPCENFTPVDVMQYALDNDGWKKEGFSASFQAERLSYLADFNMDKYEKVYCHGDWNCDNILVDDKLNVYLIDFADAMYAPAEYETVYIASALFCFEKPYMVGFFGGDYNIGDIVDLCITWLPVHAWGHATIVGNLKPVSEISSFAVLRERLRNLVEIEKGKGFVVDTLHHYDSLIEENNDPVRDPEPLKSYMDKWDGDVFIEALQLAPDKSVLEIGVGTGRLAIRVCDKCGSLTGVDISPKTIERAKENLRDYPNVNLICGDFFKHSFAETFDVIYSSLTFMHIQDKRSAARKVADLLNPNGRFVLSISKEQQTMIDYGSRQIEIYPDTPEKITELLTDAKLIVEKQFETEYAHIFAAVKGATV